MSVTYADVKKILAQYAGRGGKCYSENSEEVDLFAREVLQFMLISGAYGNQRTYCFNAYQGCITLPYELDVPLKVKVDNVVGEVWDRWFQFYPGETLSGTGCCEANEALSEEPNMYPTVYDIPSEGGRPAVIATACEDTGAQVVVQGLDMTGREIVTNHAGVQVYGEVLKLKRGEFRYTQATFSKITGVQKSRTNGYVQLLSYNPTTQRTVFLADYTPYEENPSYRRYRLTGPYAGRTVKVSVLGRIRIKDRYANNEFIPFDNLLAIRLAGQRVHADVIGDVATSQAKDALLGKIIMQETTYKKPATSQPMEVFPMMSGCAIKNIVGY